MIHAFKRLLSLVLLLCLLCGAAQADYAADYDEAQRLLAQGQYARAAKLFESLHGYADASLLSAYCQTVDAAERGEYALAFTSLNSLGDYKDCAFLRVYYAARQTESAGDNQSLLDAAVQYSTIPFFRDSLTRSHAALCTVLARAVCTMAYAAQLAPRNISAYIVSRAQSVWPLPGGSALVYTANETYLLDGNGNLLLPYAFGGAELPLASADADSEDENAPVMFQIRVNGKVGVIDSTGREILPPVWGYIASRYGNGLIAVGAGRDCVGYASLKDGEIVIPMQYESAGKFSEGLAPVKKDGLWGFINTRGDMVIAPQFQAAESFEDGMAFVAISSEEWGLIDHTGLFTSDKRWKGPVSFDADGLFRFTQNRRTMYMNRLGEIVDPPPFQTYGEREGMTVIQQKFLFGFLDEAGRIAITPQYDSVGGFSEGLSYVKKDGLFGYIDKTGELVIPLQFSDADDFSAGLAPVEKDGKYGYIDQTGAFVIAPQFDYADVFTEGLAFVRIGQKFGYIDQTGAFVIAPQFYRAEPFEQGLAWVELYGQPGEALIDQTGRVLVSGVEHWMVTYAEDRLWVKIKEKWHLIELSTGKFIL